MGFHCDVEAMSLRENLSRARTGDFIVTSQNKVYTLLHIYGRQDDVLTIEEITVPASRLGQNASWRQWLKLGAPQHTCWVLYNVQLSTGKILESYSVPQHVWLNVPPEGQFLPTLLNLNLYPVPENERQRVGRAPDPGYPDRRPIWQPKMMVDGQPISGVAFSAWQTRWPNDNSPLSGKWIEIFVPEENDKYPSYFPYWLQVKGISGSRVTIYIIDSGSNLASPAAPIPKR